MLCLGENKIKGRKKVHLLLLHLLSKSFPKKHSGKGFIFVLALNKKKSSALLKFYSAKTALLGKIYSLKPLCDIPDNHDTPDLPDLPAPSPDRPAAGPVCQSAARPTWPLPVTRRAGRSPPSLYEHSDTSSAYPAVCLFRYTTDQQFPAISPRKSDFPRRQGGSCTFIHKPLTVSLFLANQSRPILRSTLVLWLRVCEDIGSVEDHGHGHLVVLGGLWVRAVSW